MSQKSFTLSFLILLFLAPSAWSAPNPQDEADLDVCVVPHSHLDPGWKLTFDAYYEALVKKILERVLVHLWCEPKHTFIWAEMCFFAKWYDVARKEVCMDCTRCAPNGRPPTWEQVVQKVIREPVARPQFEFVGGGWVQPDEALPSLAGWLAQIDEGARYLQKELRLSFPSIAFQIDPFGHSSLQPSLLPQFGQHSTVLNRMHYRVKAALGKSANKEFWWAAPQNGSGLWTHVLFDHYVPEVKGTGGFDWEYRADPITDSNVNKRVQTFVKMIRARAVQYRTRHILFLWGDDFRFVQPDKAFENMDKLLAAVKQQHPNLAVRYCTVGEYVRAARSALPQPPLTHRGALLPYRASFLDPWTGFYSTRPHLKALIRRAETELRTAEIVHAAAVLRGYPASTTFSALMNARREVALSQHHDAITGTCTEEVAKDYESRLNRALVEIRRHTIAALSSILPKTGASNSLSSPTRLQALKIRGPLGQAAYRLSKLPAAIVVVNSLHLLRTEYLELELPESLPADSSVSVEDASGRSVEVQIRVGDVFVAEPSEASARVRLAIFRAKLPAGASALFFVREIRHHHHRRLGEEAAALERNPQTSSIRIHNGGAGAVFSPRGDLQSLEDEQGYVSLQSELRKYLSGKKWGSGAYLFRTRLHPYMLLGLAIGGVVGATLGKISRTLLFYFKFLRSRARQRASRVSAVGLLGGLLLFHAVSQWLAADSEHFELQLGATSILVFSLFSVSFLGLRSHAILLLMISCGFVAGYVYLPTQHSRLVMETPNVIVSRGALYQELVQEFPQQMVTIRSRVYNTTEDLAAEHDLLELTIGVRMPEQNEEAVWRLVLPGRGAHTLHTDDGLNLIERPQYDYLELVPGNYYPAISHTLISDFHPHAPLHVLLSHSLGVGNLDSAVEFKLHRRLAQDDEQGLDSAVQDVRYHIIRMWLVLDSSPAAAARARTRLNNPPAVFALENWDDAETLQASLAAAGAKLPSPQHQENDDIDDVSLRRAGLLHPSEPTDPPSHLDDLTKMMPLLPPHMHILTWRVLEPAERIHDVVFLLRIQILHTISVGGMHSQEMETLEGALHAFAPDLIPAITRAPLANLSAHAQPLSNGGSPAVPLDRLSPELLHAFHIQFTPRA